MTYKLPELTSLFDALAGGESAALWGQSLIDAIKQGENLEACIFEDRPQMGGLLIAGRKPAKVDVVKETFTLSVCGLDRGVFFTATMRIIVKRACSEQLATSLRVMAEQAAALAAQYGTRLDGGAGQSGQADPSMPWGIFVAGTATRRMVEDIQLYGPARQPVLITGETGTGKERVAQALHAASGRTGNLLTLNCGCISPELLASELFGYVKGAFTGANMNKPGIFEAANGGTVFLDEIGDMPARDQVALLRVLQEGTVRPLGATQEKKVDVRVIAATHMDLQQMVEAGTFRRDLYYRLKGLAIHVAALRERRDEILPLTDYKLAVLGREMKREVVLTKAARLAVASAPWEGNVRELMQCLEAAAVRARGGAIDIKALELDGALSAQAMPHLAVVKTGGEVKTGREADRREIEIVAGEAAAGVGIDRNNILHFARAGAEELLGGASFEEVLESIERTLLVEMLTACEWNLRATTRRYLIPLTTLRRRVRKYGLTVINDDESDRAKADDAAA